jgi:ATP-dependent DNA helicase
MNCRLIKELLTYNSANRLLITGTPLQNNIQSWFDFSSVLDSTGQKQVIERRKRNLVSTMHAILKPFLLRRIKTDVEYDLPKKREYILYAPLTPEQKELYLEIMRGSSRSYLEGKAVERIEARNNSANGSRSQSLKRKASGSDSTTPTKSLKSSRDSTPAAAGRGSARRRKGRQSYKDVTDREFNASLKRLEKGISDDEEPEDDPSESELLEIERAQTVQMASMYPFYILVTLSC